MAIAFVQDVTSAAGNEVDSLGVTLGTGASPVTTGNLIVVAGGVDDGSGGTCTDAASSDYTERTDTGSTSAFICDAIAAGSGEIGITWNPTTASVDTSFGAAEFSGVDTSDRLDVDDGATTGSSAAPSISITTTVDGALVVAVVTFTGAATGIAPNGTGTTGTWTEFSEVETAGTASEPHNAVYLITTTAGTYVHTWTLDNSRTFSAYAVSYNPAAATKAHSKLEGMPSKLHGLVN